MITGSTNSNLEATVDINLQDNQGDLRTVQCILDTGFTGFLALTENVIHALDLTPRGNRETSLLSGITVLLPVYLATVDWHGDLEEVSVLQTEGESLVGMALLENSTLTIRAWDGGDVLIDPR